MVAALLGGVAACTSDDGASAPSSTTSTTESATSTTTTEALAEELAAADVEALYAAPDPVPDGEPGDLLRYQVVEPAPVEGATTYRIMYLSESVAGDPIVVTGLGVVPAVPAPDDGRPVLTIAHGTTGIADECAPSKEGSAELGIAAPAVARGWALALTDYEGLGTPGRHPYLVGESEGRSTIDAARAVAELPAADTSPTTMIAGYSQGGHGALWADAVAAEWAPELDVVGTFAGAPASELPVILAAATSPGVNGFALMIVAGIAAAYPEADPALVLTDEGLATLSAVDEGCVSDVFQAAGAATGPLFKPGAGTVEPWATLAAENDAGRVTGDDPVLIIHSAQDETVPVSFSAVVADRLCAAGQPVERRVLEDGGGHGPAAVPAYSAALEWFDQILAGEAIPAPTCS